jgi:rubrerythrin
MWYGIMTLFDRIREAFGEGQTEGEFRYHCRDCETDFTSTEPSRSEIECPSCSATGPRSISKF